MSNYEKEGGAAFPHDSKFPGAKGMTLRDYFIAHAPAEPQPWFEPVMQTERPVYKHIPYPEKPYDLTNEEKGELEEVYDFVITASEVKQPRVIAHLKACREVERQRDEANEAIKQWDAEKLRQLYIQWPAAWADAMLEQRNKGAA